MRGTLPPALAGAATAVAGWLIAPEPASEQTAQAREPHGRTAAAPAAPGVERRTGARPSSREGWEPDPDLDEPLWPDPDLDEPLWPEPALEEPPPPDPDFDEPPSPEQAVAKGAGRPASAPERDFDFEVDATDPAAVAGSAVHRPGARRSADRPPGGAPSDTHRSVQTRGMPAPQRPVIAVVGLASRAGATTVARALAVALALRDPGSTAAVCGGAPGRRPPIKAASAAVLPAGPAGRLAGVLGGLVPVPVSAAGRLCLVPDGGDARAATVESVRGLAPLVIDAGRDLSPEEAASLADHVILVAGRTVEPALLDAVAATLVSSRVPVRGVADRVEAARWSERDVQLLPADRTAAAAARGGRKGRLSELLADLADSCLVAP